MEANYVQRLRIVFSKCGTTRFIGNLDLARTLERSIKRARLPLAYTQGFNPRPRLQLADALPLGVTSNCEIVDIWLMKMVDPGIAKTKLLPVMAPGLTIQDIFQVELRSEAIQNLITASNYQVILIDPVEFDKTVERANEFLSLQSVIRQRRGKEYDLRPLVHSLSVEEDSDGVVTLSMELSLSPGKTGRPDEVLRALNLDPLSARIHRTGFVYASTM